MSIKVYSYSKCGTCRKALKFLESSGVEPEVVDIVENPPSKKELKSMLASYEGDIRKLFNTSGQVYRAMNLKESLPEMSNSQAIDLLSNNGKLVKRPFLIKDDVAKRVGFKEQEWAEILP